MKFPKCLYIVWHKSITGQGWYEVLTTINEAVDEACDHDGEVAMYTLSKQGKPVRARSVEWK